MEIRELLDRTKAVPDQAGTRPLGSEDKPWQESHAERHLSHDKPHVNVDALPGADPTDRTTRAEAVQAAIDHAVNNLIPAGLHPTVFIPNEYGPAVDGYAAANVNFDDRVRMVREGQQADVHDLQAYGAAGDGSTDDGASVDAWLNQGAGDRCFAPGATYRVPGSHEIASDTIVFGAGETTVFELIDDSQLVRFTVSEIKGGAKDLGAVFQNDQSETRSSGIVLRDLVVDGRSAQLTTTAQTFANIAFVNAERCLVEDVVSRDANKNLTDTDIGNQFRAFCLVFADTEEMVVRGGRYVDAGYENMGVRGSSFKTVIDGAHIHKNGDFGRHGVEISDSPKPTHFVVTNCIFTGQNIKAIAHRADYVDVSNNIFRDISGRAISFIDGCQFGTAASNQITTDADPDASVIEIGLTTNDGSDHIVISNNNLTNSSTSSSHHGIRLVSGSQFVTIADNQINVSGGRGIYVTDNGTIGLRVVNNQIQGGTTGVFIESDTTGSLVVGNTVLSGTNFGIVLQDTASDTIVEMNDISRPGTAFTEEGTVSGTKFRRNVGYVTENSGTATVASGNTSVTVSHGLDEAPNADDISVTPTNDPTNDVGNFWISSVGASSFDINVGADPGSGGATFAWGVELL